MQRSRQTLARTLQGGGGVGGRCRVVARVTTDRRLPLGRRGYADEAQAQPSSTPSDKIKLSLVLPHQTIFASDAVSQVNIAATSGDAGILANHVPVIEQLRPGVLEVLENTGGESKKWFVSGGFALVHPNNSITINAIEAYTLDKFNASAISSALSDAQRVVSGSGTDAEKAEAGIEVEVFEALQSALAK